MKFKEYLKEQNKDLVKFLTDNPYPSDKDFHNFADSQNIDPDDLEKEAYAIVSTFFSGGRFKEKNLKESDLDPKELSLGIKVEMEHLDPKSKYAKILAKRIAMDHLAELDLYYTKLKKMEGE